jgi:curved DNA-binding protein
MEYKDYTKAWLDKTPKKRILNPPTAGWRVNTTGYEPRQSRGGRKFKEINEAYQCFLTPKSVRNMTNSVLNGSSTVPPAQPGRLQLGPWRSQPRAAAIPHHEQEELNEMLGGMGGFSDFFETLFGGFGMGGFSTQTARQAGSAGARRAPAGASRDVVHEVEITLEEAFNGTKRLLQLDGGKRIEASIPPGVDTGSRVR